VITWYWNSRNEQIKYVVRAGLDQLANNTMMMVAVSTFET
jgi:hypothetical protein